MGSCARSPNQLITELEETSGRLAPGLVACPNNYTYSGPVQRESARQGTFLFSRRVWKAREDRSRRIQKVQEKRGQINETPGQTSRKKTATVCKHSTRMHSHPNRALEGAHAHTHTRTCTHTPHTHTHSPVAFLSLSPDALCSRWKGREEYWEEIKMVEIFEI